MYMKDLNATRFVDYGQYLLDNLDADPDVKQGIRDFIDIVPFTEFNVWTIHKVMFSNNNVSTGSYLCFMTYRTEDGLMRVYTARI